MWVLGVWSVVKTDMSWFLAAQRRGGRSTYLVRVVSFSFGTLESRVCVQLPNQLQANHQPPSSSLSSPSCLPLQQIKSHLFLYCGGLLPAMSLTSLSLNCWFYASLCNFSSLEKYVLNVSVHSWVELLWRCFPYRAFAALPIQKHSALDICPFSSVCIFINSNLSPRVPAVRPIWWWPSGSYRDWGVLQGAVAAARAGRRV